MNYNSVYELAVANVRHFDPRAMDVRECRGDKSFQKTLKRALIASNSNKITEAERAEWDEIMEWSWKNNWRPSFIPDLWYVDAEHWTVHLFEIEDTSKLSSAKLSKLIDFWWTMDEESWCVSCYVFDRYGLQPRKIDLHRAAYQELRAAREAMLVRRRQHSKQSKGSQDGANP